MIKVIIFLLAAKLICSAMNFVDDEGVLSTLSAVDYTTMYACANYSSGTDMPWKKYGASGFWSGAWTNEPTNVQECREEIRVASDETYFYIRVGEWYIYREDAELFIAFDYLHTAAATGERGVGLKTSGDIYKVSSFPGPSIEQIGISANGWKQVAVSDDFTSFFALDSSDHLYVYSGTGTNWDLLNDAVELKYIDVTKPSDQIFIVGVSTVGEEIYLLKYPESTEFALVPTTSKPPIFKDFSVAQDGTISVVDDTPGDGGNGPFHARLFEWTCLGVPSTEASVCQSHGVCVESDNCDCFGGYTGFECETAPVIPEPNDDDYFTLLKGTPLESNLPPFPGCDVDSSSISSRSESSGFYFDNSRIYIFGGFGIDEKNQTGLLNDVWTFNKESRQWCYVRGNLSASDTKNEFSEVLEFSDDNDPSSRSSCSSFSTTFSFIVFGGKTQFDEFDKTKNIATNDLWEFEVVGKGHANQWRILKEENNDTSSHPPKRWGGCMASGNDGNIAFLFGGDDGPSTSLFNDLWTYDVQNNVFTKLRDNVDNLDILDSENYVVEEHFTASVFNSSINPPPRSSAICWLDPESTNFFVFGGKFKNSYTTNDMWIWNVTEQSWAYLLGGTNSTDNELAPSPLHYQYDPLNLARSRSGMIWFSNQERYNDVNNVYFFGGLDERLGVVMGDMWAFSNSFQQFKFLNGSLLTDESGDGDMIGSRAAGVGIAEPNKKLYIFGGIVFE